MILGLLLIAGSVLFIVSAQQISKLYFGLGLDGLFNALDVEFRQRREAKIVAGVSKLRVIFFYLFANILL